MQKEWFPLKSSSDLLDHVQDCKNTAAAPHTQLGSRCSLATSTQDLTSKPTRAQLAAYQAYCSHTVRSHNAAANKTLDRYSGFFIPNQARFIFTTPREAVPDSPCILHNHLKDGNALVHSTSMTHKRKWATLAKSVH